MLRLYSALLGLSLIWGLSFVFMKWLLEPAGVWGTVFLRCLAGAIILLPVLWRKRKEITGPLPWKSLIVVGICNAGLPWGLISLSETTIQSNTASILNATTPIWAGIMGVVVFSVVLTARQWFGIMIGFFGILVLMNFQFGHILARDFVGIGTMLLATMSYGFASQYAKRFLSNTGVLVITTYSLLVGALVGLAGMVLTEPIKPAMLFHSLPIFAVIGLGCFGSGIAHLLFYYMMAKGGPEFATTVTYVIPATAMIWGYVLLGEPITSNLIVGLLIIFAGVYLSSKKAKAKSQVEASGA
ncbi:DMT family transporter [Aneurinibacillus tyrosinisolvens]|uniref:DMT family transporter n=1 Tax=Aneurinibacillus tyrosinisolvens TaxID=1443435 RepID=UPI00063F35BD|nr:DMT family transporter [Aneurinibacillus tyrosinisolvens]